MLGSGQEAYVWTPQSGMQGVGFLGNGDVSTLYQISNSGVAVGGSTTLGGSYANAMIWSATGGLQELNNLIDNPPTTWTPTAAVAISKSGGFIAGIGYSILSTDPPSGTEHAFLLNGGSLTEIPDPGVEIFPRSVNNSGEAVGFYSDSSDHIDGFVYSGALGTIDIGTLGLSATGSSTPYVETFGINDLGTVVGSEGLADGSEYGFLWTAAGGMVEVTPPPGVVIDGLSGINDSGQLIGQGYYSNDPALGYRGFVLTPVSEPSALALSAAFALLLLAVCRNHFSLRVKRIAAGYSLLVASAFLGLLVASDPRPATAQMYATAGSQQYLVTDIGNLSSQYPFNLPTAINSSGQVVGNSNVSPSDGRTGTSTPVKARRWSTLAYSAAEAPTPRRSRTGSTTRPGSSAAAAAARRDSFGRPRRGCRAPDTLQAGTFSVLEAINNSDVAVGAATPAAQQ